VTDATTRPRIIYSCFTKIGASGLGLDALELLKGIHAHGALVKGVFYGSRQNDIPKDRLRLIRFHPYQVFSNFSSRYYYPLKRIHLDRVASAVIRREGCDVFHGWSTESIRSIEAAHEVGAVAFVERASLHPKVSMDLLEEEYDRFGIQRRPVRLHGLLATIDAVSRSLTVGLEEFVRADRIIVQSPYAVETFVQQGVPREKLVVVPRAVDISRFTPPSSREQDRTFRALFAGQLCLRKGLPYLLRAWTALRLRDAELILLGPLHDDVKSVLAKVTDPSVKHVPWSDNTADFYRRASVLVLPSLVEGSAKVTYEAMACGVPVIVTPNTGAVARDRQEGFVVPIRDDGAIKEALLTLYENRDLGDAYGRTGRKTVEKYSWDYHREVMWEAYQQAFAGAH
jgi:glycosyltransferase involved in cell wall biosynthesis